MSTKLLLCLIAVAAAAFGQTTFATLTGTVAARFAAPGNPGIDGMPGRGHLALLPVPNYT